MRPQNIFAGALGLAAIAASAPALSVYDPPDTCEPSVSAVFVTVAQPVSTSYITLHDASTRTVYVNAPSTSTVRLMHAPTTTLTQSSTTIQYSATAETVNRAYVPSSVKMAAGVVTSEISVFDATDTQMAVVTVTEVSLASFLSGADVTYSETAKPNGLINYVVENGTTYWLNGQTPNPTEAFVLMTSVVTVLPVPSSASNSDETLTTTLKTTIYTRLTFTETISLKNSSAPTSTVYGAQFGTSSSFTGMASGGWNATWTVSAKGVVGTGAAGFSPFPTSATLVLSKPSLDIYHTKSAQPSITIETLSAQSGFNVYTTFSTAAPTSPPGSPSAAENGTTLILNGQTVTWGGSTTAVDAASSLPSYANTTASPVSVLHTATSARVGTTASHVIDTTAISFIPLSSSVLSVASTPGISNYTILTAASYSSQLTTHATTPSVATLSQSPTSEFSTASAAPSVCGEVGDFTLNFDDIPPLSIGNQSIDTVQPAPIFSPYHQFDFSNGFTVVPPPRTLYAPSSKPLFLEFIPNFTVNTSNVGSGPNSKDSGFSGDIANGDHGVTGCFSFNMYGASFGCDSGGPDCLFNFTGSRYDPVTGLTNPVTNRLHSISACYSPTRANCPLQPITLDDSFKDLDVVRISSTSMLFPKIWWMDDLRLGWYNNACVMGLCRQSAHIRRVRSLAADEMKANLLA